MGRHSHTLEMDIFTSVENVHRFSEVAELVSVCWLDILGIMQAKMSSPETNYTAYLVYKLTEYRYGLNCKRKH
ncbi:hypothetical protein RD792_009690, partial [Penstemon davidsonii]